MDVGIIQFQKLNQKQIVEYGLYQKTGVLMKLSKLNEKIEENYLKYINQICGVYYTNTGKHPSDESKNIPIKIINKMIEKNLIDKGETCLCLSSKGLKFIGI